ncbi:MAG: tyrosine-type recombinase/integrase [Candidatus Obscuribacterales bacterium]|jgi:integrase|nr:tyrosine-type recombinase/integrase [Candidatus Obscuribacterales bacterium]
MALTSAEARDLLLLELFTGLRHGEAIRLEWKNIDFKHKTILVEDTKNHKEHMLPMSTYLLAIIEKRSLISGSSQFVFQSVSSKHGHISDIRDSIKQVIASSGVEFTEHDLRRLFCYLRLKIRAGESFGFLK